MSYVANRFEREPSFCKGVDKCISTAFRPLQEVSFGIGRVAALASRLLSQPNRMTNIKGTFTNSVEKYRASPEEVRNKPAGGVTPVTVASFHQKKEPLGRDMSPALKDVFRT